MGFPADFWWGSGMSGAVAEGPAPGSDQRAWREERVTGRGPAEVPASGVGFGADGPDDLTLLARHGLTHLRLTLDWSRLEPTPGAPSTEAIDRYRLVLQQARDAGLSVWACLHDGALPGWFSHDERGFADVRSRGYFWARHVEHVGEAFGDLVHGWVPLFEPSRWATRGWLDAAAPPGHRDDAKGFAEALEAVQLASVDAALRLREGGQPVASAQWLVPVFAARTDPDLPPTPEAEAAASVVDETLRRSWLRMLTEETLLVPGRSPVEVPGAREAFDVIGFTYRHAVAVRGDGALLPYPQALPSGADGQASWPEGLGLVLHRLAESLPDRPLLLAGVGTATGDEGGREQYLRDVLAILDEAVAGGVPLRGAWWDTPIGAGRGLFDPDRAPRPAAELLSAVAHGADVPT